MLIGPRKQKYGVTLNVLIRHVCARGCGDKLYKDSGAYYIREGFRGSRSGACWNIPSEVKNKLSHLILLIDKEDAHVLWVLWILEAVYATLRILRQSIDQVVRSLAISSEAQRKRGLCIRTRLQDKLLCHLAIGLETSHEVGMLGGESGKPQ